MGQYWRHMLGFVSETKRSEISGQGELAEYELKSWVNINKNMWGFVLGIKNLNEVDMTDLQNLNLSFGSILKRICEDLYWKLKKLN